MDRGLIKILKFELKANYMEWIRLFAISATLMGMYISYSLTKNAQSIIIGGTFIPLFILMVSIFTLFAYKESETKQTIEMYHLIPVSRNNKFFSKQFITFIAFPFALLLLLILFVFIIGPFINSQPHRNLFSPRFDPSKVFTLYIWAHSIATFFAIIFKKNKVLYSIITFILIQFILGIIIFNIQKLTGHTNWLGFLFSKTSNEGLRYFVMFFIPMAIYLVSYRLFFRRQL